MPPRTRVAELDTLRRNSADGIPRRRRGRGRTRLAQAPDPLDAAARRTPSRRGRRRRARSRRSVRLHRSTTVRPRQAPTRVDLDVALERRHEPGRITCATASASWIGAPSQPYVSRWKTAKKSTSRRRTRRASRRPQVPLQRRRRQRAVRDVEADHRRVEPACEDARCAASGSAQMLNSAAGVMLPSAIAPPISTIRSTFAPSGAREQQRDVRQRAGRDERDRRRAGRERARP